MVTFVHAFVSYSDKSKNRKIKNKKIKNLEGTESRMTSIPLRQYCYWDGLFSKLVSQ